MTNGDEEDEDDSLEEVFGIDVEARRERNIEQVTFEECEEIRRAGRLFREFGVETPLEAVDFVTEELDLDEDRVSWLLSIYKVIHTELTENVSFRVDKVGRGFFSGSSIDELSELEERQTEEIREDVRAFVGSFILSEDLDEVNLDEPVPDDPYQPYSEILDNLMIDVPSLLGDVSHFTNVPALDVAELFKPFSDFEAVLPTVRVTTDFEKSFKQVHDVFQELDFSVDEEVFRSISTIAESPPDDWEERAIVQEFEDLEIDESLDVEGRERFEDEGSKAIETAGRVDRGLARDIYNTWWRTARTIAEETGARISDETLAVIAAAAAIFLLYTGNIGVTLVFVFQVLVHLSKLDD